MQLLRVTAAVAAIMQSASAVTVYLAGDSTMAPGGGGSGTQGWGEYLKYSLTSDATVSNKAIAGRSARSYSREGRFDAIVASAVSGDYVIIEFGHNDGGSLTPTDNGRTDCGGTGTETCQTTYNGVAETVRTFPFYLEYVAAELHHKGVKVIISSQTPNNPDESGTFTYSPSRFVGYAQVAAAGVSTGAVPYVDHGQYTANMYKTRSVATVDSYFPNDHTHTAPLGADLVARAFVKGVLCVGSDLAAHIKNTTASIEGSCI